MADPVYHDDFPMGYLITIRCYGTWFHGDERGSVDRDHNDPGTPLISAHRGRSQSAIERMTQQPYVLNHVRRPIALNAIIEVCEHRGWTLHAAHIREEHVHIVVSYKVKPERIMNAFKSYASRALNIAGLDSADRNRWSRHGSTKWLWTIDEVETAIQYTLDEQGERMEHYEHSPKT